MTEMLCVVISIHMSGLTDLEKKSPPMGFIIEGPEDCETAVDHQELLMGARGEYFYFVSAGKADKIRENALVAK
jgi:hypothetical protein